MCLNIDQDTRAKDDSKMIQYSKISTDNLWASCTFQSCLPVQGLHEHQTVPFARRHLKRNIMWQHDR